MRGREKFVKICEMPNAVRLVSDAMSPPQREPVRGAVELKTLEFLRVREIQDVVQLASDAVSPPQSRTVRERVETFERREIVESLEILEERNDVQSASAMSRLGSRLVPEDLEIRREELRRPSDVRLKNEENRFESGLAQGDIRKRDRNIREIE